MVKYVRIVTCLLIVTLAATSPACGQFHVSLEPNSARLIHLPGFRVGIPGGIPSPHELHFGLQGEFDIEVTGETGHIRTASLVLHGNEEPFVGQEAWRDQIQQEALQLLLDAEFAITLGPPRDRTEMRAKFSPLDDELVLEFFRNTLVRMEGGVNRTPFDGSAYLFAYPVPEPSCWRLLTVTAFPFLQLYRRNYRVRTKCHA